MQSADSMYAEAADKLKQTVRQGLTFDAAQVKVIGLEHIRQKAGAQWPHMADRIRTNSLAFIEGCLSDGDIALPCGDGFLVIFAQKREGADELTRQCDGIQDALDTFYLGEDGMQMLRTQVDSQRVRATDMVKLLGPEPPPRPAQSPANDALEMKFVPIWSVERQTAGIYIATPFFRTSQGQTMGYDRAYREAGQHKNDDYAAFDLSMLDHLSALLETRGEACGVLVYSVHATTMQRRTSRGAFLAKLAEIPEHRRRQMMGGIAEIEPGTPIVTIADWVHQLRAYTARVAIELHVSERGIAGFETVGAWSIGCVMPSGAQTLQQRARNEATIRAWTTQAHRQHIKCALLNLLDPHLIEAAALHGADYFSSELIWPTLPAPEGLRPFSRIQLRQALWQIGPRPLAAAAVRAG